MTKRLDHTKIAKRYVASLFACFTTKKQSQDALTDLNDLQAMIVGSDDLQAFLTSPLLTRDDHKDGLQKLAKKAKLTEAVTNLLLLLAENRRLALLPAVIEEANLHALEQSGTVQASILTARKLTAADEKKIANDLKAVTGKNIIANSYVDENLIGGMIVQVGSTLIDGSIRSKLNAMEQQLTQRGAA